VNVTVSRNKWPF